MTTAEDPFMAHRGLRLLAFMFDVALLALPVVLGLSARPPQPSGALAGALFWWLLVSVCQCVLLVGRGQSIGKTLLGIRIVDDQGNLPGPGRLLAREGTRLAFWAIPGCGPFSGLWDGGMAFGDAWRAGHDRIAGTYVVRSQGPVVVPIGVPRLSEVRSSRIGGAAWLLVAGAAVSIPVLVTWVAFDVHDQQVRRNKARRGEVPGNVDASGLRSWPITSCTGSTCPSPARRRPAPS